MKTAAVIIGRNEGDRLLTCLNALSGQVARIIYVDSGSTDGSVEAAAALGAETVILDLTKPFTAARARNAGCEKFDDDDTIEYVQFVDGDCEIQPGWLKSAEAFLDTHTDAAVVCGQREERYPDATLWNRLTAEEWAAPAGKVKSCGGDSMMRLRALKAVHGFNPALIAGEEPELCVRLRQAGWEIWRLSDGMTLHDAAMTRFGQWWQRSRRAGYTYAEGVAMHGARPERHNVVRLRRTLFWGLGLPFIIVLGGIITPWAFTLICLWPIQIFRLRRSGLRWTSAAFLMLAKFAETQGVFTWLWRQRNSDSAKLIEYK